MITRDAPAPNVTPEKTSRLTPDLLAYIESVVWGFRTGVRYRILERRAEIERALAHGHFLLLQKDAQTVGTLLCLEKDVSLGNDSDVAALYETALSVSPTEQGLGLAKHMIQEAGAAAKDRCIEYAYIEEKNVPSAAAFKALGFQAIGRFCAMTFNRLHPKRSSRAAVLPSELSPWMKKALSDLYRHHALGDFDVSFRPKAYWVVMENNWIVAGAQIEEESWSIRSMPGPEGWFAVNLLPNIPILRRILNPKKISVLKIGNLFVPEGHEKDFMELVEHLTLAFRHTLALAYLDKNSPVTQRLQKRLRFGIFNLFFETPVKIWARFYGFKPTEVTALQDRPFVISPLDIS